jgi:hypothetical protein
MLDRLAKAAFGKTSTIELEPATVDALVDGPRSPESTDRLLDFGRALLRANDERAAALDSKATMIVGYSTAVLAFMLSRSMPVVGQPFWLVLPWLSAGIFAAIACVSAGMALRAAQNWRNMGEATWFPKDVATIADPDRLGRWYLTAMHQSLQENHRITNQKASETICAQLAVSAAGTSLALGLALALVLAALAALLGSV